MDRGNQSCFESRGIATNGRGMNVPEIVQVLLHLKFVALGIFILEIIIKKRYINFQFRQQIYELQQQINNIKNSHKREIEDIN